LRAGVAEALTTPAAFAAIRRHRHLTVDFIGIF
jgi:hypothetical protein